MSTTLGVSAALVDGELVPGDVRVDGDTVTDVGLPPAPGGRIATPGLVDLQVNGFAGVDLMAADVEEMRSLAARPAAARRDRLPPHAHHGPRRRHRPSARPAQRGVRDVRRHGGALPRSPPRGPVPLPAPARYASAGAPPRPRPRRAGRVAPPRRRRRGDPRPGASRALDLIKGLASDGVLVSLGHSDATAHEAGLGFDAGARTVTHLFNAMSPLHHREPGLPGAALARPESSSSSCSTATTSPPRSSGSSGRPRVAGSCS